MKKLTPEAIKKASELAEKNMQDKLKTMSSGELQDWIRFWNARYFRRDKK